MNGTHVFTSSFKARCFYSGLIFTAVNAATFSFAF